MNCFLRLFSRIYYYVRNVRYSVPVTVKYVLEREATGWVTTLCPLETPSLVQETDESPDELQYSVISAAIKVWTKICYLEIFSLTLLSVFHFGINFSLGLIVLCKRKTSAVYIWYSNLKEMSIFCCAHFSDLLDWPC